jgi:hypothetical protein
MSAVAVTMLGDDWLARMDEGGWRVEGPTARITHTPQHAVDIGREYPSLIPPSSAVPTAAEKQQYDDDDDQKGCVVHIALLRGSWR